MATTYVVALHGGAGTIAPGSESDQAPYRQALRDALAVGRALLAADGSAVDAVVATVQALEDCALFNAGHGAVFNAAGEHELDAAVMDGRSLMAGAVAGARRIRNPIVAARELMRDGSSVLLGADGADRFARDRGLAMVEPDYFSTPQRLEQWRQVRARSPSAQMLDHDGQAMTLPARGRFGTVGAVALDRAGHLAAATSTGGMTNKPPGRIGDSPIVGAGIYANDATCALSATGTGEHFIRACVAHDVHARMEYLGQSLDRAVDACIAENLGPIGGRGGVVALDRQGRLAMRFNSAGMYRAWGREGEASGVAIFAD